MSIQSKIEPSSTWRERWVDDRVPPFWLRRFLPLWLLHWYCRRFGYCWVSAVLWKSNGSDGSWHAWGCREDARRNGSCFCAQFLREHNEYPAAVTPGQR